MERREGLLPPSAHRCRHESCRSWGTGEGPQTPQTPTRHVPETLHQSLGRKRSEESQPRMQMDSCEGDSGSRDAPQHEREQCEIAECPERGALSRSQQHPGSRGAGRRAPTHPSAVTAWSHSPRGHAAQSPKLSCKVICDQELQRPGQVDSRTTDHGPQGRDCQRAKATCLKGQAATCWQTSPCV